MQKVKIKGKNRGFYMVKKNIELRVRNLIEKYGTKNPYKICEKLNINIIYTDLGSIKGYFQKVLRKKYIVINNKNVVSLTTHLSITFFNIFFLYCMYIR